MLNLIKNVFWDIISLYRNFFSWNASKILIYLFTWLLWLLFSLPFFIVSIVVAYFSPVEWWKILTSIFTDWWLFRQSIDSYIYLFSFVWAFFVFWVMAFFFWSSYSSVLLFKLSNNYLDKKYTIFLKWKYYNFRKIFTYFKIVLLFMILSIAFLLVFSLLIFLLTLLFWWVWEVTASLESGNINLYSILSFIIALIFFWVWLYITYRLIFTFIVLARDSKNNWAIYIIKKSYNLTSKLKSFLRFVILLIIMFVASLPVSYLWDYLDYKYNSLKDYIWYVSLDEETKDLLLAWDNSYYYISLELEYKWQQYDDLVPSFEIYSLVQKFFYLFYFLFVTWVSNMFLTSFYIRELKK